VPQGVGIVSIRESAISPVSATERVRVRARSNFFVGMSALLLALVLIGFAPTLYLRAFFDVPPMRPHLYLHGVVLTAWFVWFVVQTSLVKAGRITDHRRFGVIGAVLAVATVGAGVLATLMAPSGITAAGLDFNADVSTQGIEGLGPGFTILEGLSGAFWGNLGSALAFLILVGSAIALRARSDWHKRLMLLASVAIMLPALARLSRWPILGGEQGPFPLGVVSALLVALFVYDLLTARRVHRATLLGTALSILLAGGGFAIGLTDWGRGIVRALA
jgi:hypothetical protein